MQSYYKEFKIQFLNLFIIIYPFLRFLIKVISICLVYPFSIFLVATSTFLICSLSKEQTLKVVKKIFRK